MKNKLNKILGVFLPVAMILAMTVSLVPANTPTAEAADLRFSTVAIPKVGAAGKYVMAPAADVGVLATTGSIMFAAANVNGSANLTDLLKSSDMGATWTPQTSFFTTANATGDTTSIVGIKLSPDYNADTTVVVATAVSVYQSIDGGTTFSVMPGAWNVAEVITDMDIALDERGRVAVIVGTTRAGNLGEVYVNSPATTAGAFKAQLVNPGNNRNVLAVAFSPYFESDEGIFAVTTNVSGITTTEIRNAFGSTKTGGNWAASYGDGRFRDRNGADVPADGARIAFPDDFNIDALDANVAFVGLSSGTPDGQNAQAGSNELGDVYKVIFQPSQSSTVDLDVRGQIGTVQTTTNIYSIDVIGDAAAATIMVGTNYWASGVTNYYWDLYYSTDSGATWSTPRESQPTGGNPNLPTNTVGTASRVIVMLADDYATSGVAYAATSGLATSGLSRTKDGGKSWQQISLVDFAASGTYVVSEMDYVSASEWYMQFESPDSGNSSYWHTTNGGANYERFYSYANPQMLNTLDGLEFVRMSSVVYIENDAQGKFWRSTDGGKTFPRIVSAKGARNPAGVLLGGDVLRAYSIVNDTSLYVIHQDGTIRFTTNLGRSWDEPEESIIPAMGGGPPPRIVVTGNLTFVTHTSGAVYVSTDGGKKYLKTLGLTNCGPGGISMDPNWATDQYIYHSQMAPPPNNGYFRTKFNAAAPDTSEWERIDNIGLTGAISAFIDIGTGPTFNLGGIRYITAENVTDGTNRGGLWRSTNEDADIRGINKPQFTFVNAGLDNNGDTIAYLTNTFGPTPSWYVRNTGIANTANYFNQVVVYTDTLNTSADLVTPADKDSQAGASLSTTDLTMTATLSWKAKSGATSYEYQVARDTKFESIIQNGQGFTTAQEVNIGGLLIGSTYYWRVRTARAAIATDVTANGTTRLYVTAGDPIGAPLISPWSVTRTFTIGTPVTVSSRVFEIVSPAIGASNVSVQPTFTWTAFIGALNYEVMVSETEDFAIIEWSHTVNQTFYKTVENLKYDKTYYWRVRAVTGAVPATGPAPGSPWVTGIITTMAEPVVEKEKEPTVIIQKETEIKVVEVPVVQQQPIPSYLLWIIIAVGAILVIALVILIVRTRRVT